MKISVSCLGGIGEIGMNMYVYESANTAFIIDCGVKFAGSTEPGIDLIIPDFSYLKTIKNKLRCIIITHAHEDHGGALTYLLKEYPLPVASSKYTYGLLKYRLEEHGLNPEITYLKPDEPLVIGDFTLYFIPLSHSIHGTGAILIEAYDGFRALHISDYKMDFFPITSVPFPVGRFAAIGREGLNLLLADSTNAGVAGFTPGEHTAFKNLENIFRESKGRIFFTTFASNTERLQSVFDLADKYGRTVIVEGTSLRRNIREARNHGLMSIKDGIDVKRSAIHKLPDNKICVIVTGSQGERESALSKITVGDYSNITVKEGDTFIFSSRAIPGNEQNIILVMNRIAKAGGECVCVSDEKIHVSGHASASDAALLIKLTSPDYIVPIHGEYIHLQKHKNIAVNECGFDENRVIITGAGEKLIFEDGVFSLKKDIPSGKRFVDVKGGFILDKEELKIRKRMGSEGAVFIYACPDIKTGKLKSKPVAAAAGFYMGKETIGELCGYLYEMADKTTFTRFSENSWKDLFFRFTKKYFKKRLGRRPVITVTLGASS